METDMNRRELLTKAGAAIGIAITPPAILAGTTPKEQESIKGVGIVRYPSGQTLYGEAGQLVDNQDIAKEIAMAIRSGTILLLPSDRDYEGHLRWDFLIVGAPADQVKVERSPE